MLLLFFNLFPPQKNLLNEYCMVFYCGTGEWSRDWNLMVDMAMDGWSPKVASDASDVFVCVGGGGRVSVIVCASLTVGVHRDNINRKCACVNPGMAKPHPSGRYRLTMLEFVGLNNIWLRLRLLLSSLPGYLRRWLAQLQMFWARRRWSSREPRQQQHNIHK